MLWPRYILVASWLPTVRVRVRIREQQWRAAKRRTKHGLAWPAVLGFSTATEGEVPYAVPRGRTNALSRPTRSRPRSRVYQFGPAIAYPGRQTGMFWGLAWEIVHHRSQSTAVPLSNLQKGHGYRAADSVPNPCWPVRLSLVRSMNSIIMSLPSGDSAVVIDRHR